MAAGAGLYVVAVGGAALVIVTLELFDWVEATQRRLRLRAKDGERSRKPEGSGGSVVTLLSTQIEGLPLVHRGKVRETYAIGEDRLLLVATDRLSAFDVVFDQPIPDKGRVLTQLSAWWFERLAHLGPSHFISADARDLPARPMRRSSPDARCWCAAPNGSMPSAWCVATWPVPAGPSTSVTVGWWGISCRPGCARPIACRNRSSPSTKAEVGHDENITASSWPTSSEPMSPASSRIGRWRCTVPERRSRPRWA